MKALLQSLRIVISLIPVLLVGCSTTRSMESKLDPKIGHARYRDFVREYGEPSSSSTYPNGTRSAVWVFKRTDIHSIEAYDPKDSVNKPASPITIEEPVWMSFDKKGVFQSWSKGEETARPLGVGISSADVSPIGDSGRW